MTEQRQRQTIIITGSSGLIGQALIDRLHHDFDILGFDVKEPTAPLPPSARFVECDLTDDQSTRNAVDAAGATPERPIASVLHLAAYYDFSGEPSDLYEKVTVRGTERLLRTLRDRPVEQFIFSSTMLVHRPTEPGRPITEDDPLEARWDYPQSKIDTEAVVREARAGIHAVLLRIAGVYTDRCQSIPVANQIQRIRERRLTGHVYPGDTSHGQAFVHLDDLTDAFERVVSRRHTLPEEIAILVGEPETPSYEEIQRRLAGLIHDEHDWTTEQIPKAVAKAGAWIEDKIPGIEDPFIKPWMIDLADDHYELDISRARELLGWEPKRRLLDTLPAMVAHLERDPQAWYKAHDLEPVPENAA